MRTQPILLAVGLTLAACEDSGRPSTGGTLVVATSTVGNEPDRDGYLLTVDGVDSLPLDPTGSFEIELPTGQHTLRLLGMAAQCSVSPETPLDVEIPAGETTSVAFEITCSATGVRVRVRTSGLDFDVFDGYHLEVDGTDRGTLPTGGTVFTRLDPGSRTIALTGLAPNCTIDGPDSHTVTVVDAEITPVEFVVVCTATSGVIGVLVDASGPDMDRSYQGMVDGSRSFSVRPGRRAYLTAVSAGDHVVSLAAPANCSVEGDRQSVTVAVGGLIRDTVEVAFSVTCVPRVPGRLRITAPTTGPIPTAPYSVWICRENCMSYGSTFLGALVPNDTLVSNPQPGRYGLLLRDVPGRCNVQGNAQSFSFTVTYDATIDIEYRVRCSP
jgi:hypothetical protein